MKRISIIVSIVVFSILSAVIIYILCAGNTAELDDSLPENTIVGLVMNGKKDDSSWGQSHYDALSRISGELNITLLTKESVSSGESFEKTVDGLVGEGCRIIICGTVDYESSINTVSERYPEVYFLEASGNVTGRNVASYYGRMYQLRYLSGFIAGMHTKTGHIGYVASYPMSEVNRGINAFTLGVRKSCPAAVVHVLFCNSWDDDEKAYQASVKLIDEYRADIIASHSDSLEPLRAADEKGILSIGNNYDNTELYPGSLLVCCIWRWDDYYKSKISSAIRGKFLGDREWLGLDSGIMTLYKNESIISPEADKASDDEAERLFSRSFDVFYGPVKDNNGVLRIAADESMSDEKMLEAFDWYVEGVDVIEQQNK